MSKEFYSYLTNKITRYFKSISNIVGQRYSIYFENEEEVNELYEALRGTEEAKEFSYYENGESIYDTFYLDIDGNKMIVSATINNVQPDFLTTLRNNIGTNKEGFDNAGILIIYHNQLDSITNGTESFQREGMPFHIDSIIGDIKSILKKSDMSSVDKSIIEFDLERRKQDVFKDNTSIFEYKEILGVINKGCIEKEEYKDFRVFIDSELESLVHTKQMIKKLKENNSIFEKVDYSVKYGNVEADLESMFDEKLLSKLKKEDWESEVTYTDIQKSIEIKTGDKPLELKEIAVSVDGEQLIENIDFFIKDEGISKVKQRNKHIIIFNDGYEKFDFTFNFDKHLTKDNTLKSIVSTLNTSGKKLNATLLHSLNEVTFESINIKDNSTSAKFKFNICIVDISKTYLESIITAYLISANKSKDKCYIELLNQDDVIALNEEGFSEVEYTIEKGGTYECSADDRVKLVKPLGLFGENDDIVRIDIKVDEVVIPFAINDESKKPNMIYGLSVWKDKREKKANFIYKGNNKLQQGTSEFYTRDDFKNNIELEETLINSRGLCWQIKEGNIEEVELEIDLDIKDAYLQYLDYFKTKQLLPSLTYYSDEVVALGKLYVEKVIEIISKFEEEKPLSRLDKNLIKLGTIINKDGEEEIVCTPMHPLNVAYQIMLQNQLKDEILEGDTVIKKLSSIYLLPYIRDDRKKLYRPVEQWHSPEWKYYVPAETKRYKGSRNFVSKLVKEKLSEFVNHFSYLFEGIKNATLSVNLVNTGDCKEILQGIFSYYLSEIKDDKNIDELIPMEVNIYNSDNISHAFEEFANYDNIEEIKRDFNLSMDNKKYSDSDIINAFREKVKFFEKNESDEVYKYAHITFYEMGVKTEIGNSNMEDINSGISLDGITSGVPSVFYGDSYRTGFGTKYGSKKKNNVLELANKFNSIARVANSSDPYDSGKCLTTEIERDNEERLSKIYDSSNWVTFIEPKVDLNFFKNDEKAKNLLIIHYSDQYTSASGYDAITVTRKSHQYQSIIEEFLNQKGINDAERYTPRIINMFNAINGDWLLRLISSKAYFDKEKISILSAVKLALAYHNNANITWVPISLEEILRVSGGAGLKKSEGIFSAKNLGFENNGATSDDIMLVGIEDKNGKVIVHYHPIEVKIGKNANDYIEKAIKQVKSTKKIFMETLMPNEEGIVDLKNKVYRNFLMQLVIVSCEKLKLYDIWKDGKWDKIIDSDIREKLLNEDYEISNALDEVIGEGSVISFKKDGNFKETKVSEGVAIIEFTEEDGINFVTKEVNEIIEYIDGCSEVDKEMMLKNKTDEYDNDEEPSNNDVTEVAENKEGYGNDEGQEDAAVDKVEVINEPVKETRPMEILFGFNQSNNKELRWYPNDTSKVFHTNTGIIGTMGTGKTQFTKSVITQIYRESKYNLDSKEIGILIFDYKGDYNKSKQDFIDATNAKVFDLFHLPFNPLAIIKGPNAKPMLPLHTANSLKETLAKAFGLGIKQETLLRDLIMEAYEQRGIIKNNPSTWDSPAPTLQDVYNIYINREDLKEDSLYAAFSNIIDFEIFEPNPFETKPLFDLLEGVTVIDLSGYDPGIQNLVVAITLDLFYSQMQSLGHSKIEGNMRQLNKLVLVDEADNFLSKDFASLKKILKEGREFGVGTILSTQLLSHFSTSENDYANYILTWVVHNVADLSTKDVKYIFNTQGKSEEEELYNKIKSLNKHYSLVKMGDINRPIYIKDKAFWELVQK